MNPKSVNAIFVVILFVNAFALWLMIGDMSIHYKEAIGIFYDKHNIAFSIANTSISLFGQNDYALRFPFVFIHLCNMILFFCISRMYLKKPQDSLLVVIIYALLPGVMISSLLVLKSSIIIFVTLLICLVYMRFGRWVVLVAFVAIWIDESFAILFFALFLYFLRVKDTALALCNLLFFALNMYLYGLSFSGHPQNYFLVNLGMIVAFFSPLFLIYYIYSLHNALFKQKNILVFIGATSLFFVLLISLRQKVDLETFIPMSVSALPVAIKSFLSDMRVRLPRFRNAYVRRFVIIFVLLVCQSVLLYNNKLLYLINPKSHFAGQYHISKEVAQELKNKGITNIKVLDRRLELPLRFYGILSAEHLYLVQSLDINNAYENEIAIYYFGKKVAAFIITDDLTKFPILR